MKVTGRQTVRERLSTLLFAKFPELAAIFIVNIENGRPRRFRPATFEKHLLGAELLLPRPLIIKMASCEIREYPHLKLKSKNPPLPPPLPPHSPPPLPTPHAPPL